MVKQALAVGFSQIEIGGGQFYQTRLEHGLILSLFGTLSVLLMLRRSLLRQIPCVVQIN